MSSLNLPLLNWLLRNGPMEIGMLCREYVSLAGPVAPEAPLSTLLGRYKREGYLSFSNSLDFRGDPIIMVCQAQPAQAPAK